MVKSNRFLSLLVFAASCFLPVVSHADNQTPTTSSVITNGSLPFRVCIEKASFKLPQGIQSYVFGSYKGKWLLLMGRSNGLHNFGPGDDNFPPNKQNKLVFVVDPIKRCVHYRSLEDPSSRLTAEEIDTLSVTSPQFFQSGHTLYVSGGYGVIQSTGEFSTKNTLTAIDIPGMMKWVKKGSHCGESAKKHIRQAFHPSLRVTGGHMTRIGDNPVLLVFGQNFTGFYTDSSNGEYTQQVRRFWIKDDGKKLKVDFISSKPSLPDPNFRRRDLNVIPVIRPKDHKLSQSLVALSGVFTLSGGIWNVPVEISAKGSCFMKDPNDPQTFKQAMNIYQSANIGLYSERKGDFYSLLFGGLTYGYFENGQFLTDSEVPFTDQITAIKIDRKNRFKQYLLPVEYPVILSKSSNPGNRLLFGAGAYFIPVDGLCKYQNGVLKLDKIKKPKTIGYIVGGIQSTLPNTNAPSDSAASPYIFTVKIIPN